MASDMFTDEMGRCYCAAHRLEKCNACMYNFVEMNRMTEAEHVASRAAAPPAPPGGGDDFSVGDVIIMNNLQSAAARKLNGTSAVVTSSAAQWKGTMGSQHRQCGQTPHVEALEHAPTYCC